MQIGFDLPNRGPLANPESMARLAAEGESLGFDVLTVSDHIVMPTDIDAKYPYSDTGEFPQGARSNWYEQLTTAAWVAAKTSKIRILTSVMVVPHRQAVLTAKILATIDVLSGGRLTVGCGAGWMREEFEAVGAPPFDARGAVTDEYLQAFKELWTKDAPSFHGKYVTFSNIVFEPKPAQKPLPLWIGGESAPALRRAARYGDGWYPIGANPQYPMDTLARYRAGAERVRQLAAEAGRNPADIALAYRSHSFGPTKQGRTPEGERRLMTGSIEEAIDDLHAMRELGVSCVTISLLGPQFEPSLDRLRRFRDDVLDKL
jgi:probable F420-dependent oxidoreductase